MGLWPFEKSCLAMFFSNGDQSNDARQSHCFAPVRKRGRTGEEGKGGVMDAVVSEARTPRFSWFVLALLYLSAIVAPFSMFKVGVLAPALIPALGLDVSEVSVLMSLFNIAGFILAIPGGLLVAKMGAKRSILVSLAFTALGSLLGAFGTNFAFLCFTRVLEGAGLGLVAVCVPSAIAEWFPMRRRGLALGVFTTYVPDGPASCFGDFPACERGLGVGICVVARSYFRYSHVRFSFRFLPSANTRGTGDDKCRHRRQGSGEHLLQRVLKGAWKGLHLACRSRLHAVQHLRCRRCWPVPDDIFCRFAWRFADGRWYLRCHHHGCNHHLRANYGSDIGQARLKEDHRRSSSGRHVYRCVVPVFQHVSGGCNSPGTLCFSACSLPVLRAVPMLLLPKWLTAQKM